MTLGLLFTLGADYFLILHNWHLPGVAVFCFAHLAYICRALNAKQACKKHELASSWLSKPVIVFAWVSVAVVVVATLLVDALFVAAAVYAALFITNLYISTRYIQHNRVLVLAGLFLFAACDICVLLFNLPVHTAAPIWLRQIFPLIWVFYLPSQALLAISAVNFTRRNR